MSEINIDQILSFLQSINVDYQYVGNRNIRISTYCPLNQFKKDAICWARKEKDVPMNELNQLKNVLLLAEKGSHFTDAKFPVVYVENVHRTYFRVVAFFFKEEDPENRVVGIMPTATVLTENIGANVFIGYNTFIDKNVVIGNNVTILNNVVIQGKVNIGDDTVIESGTVIGACGFGHYRDEDGHPVCVSHFGGVKIGNHVKIGANNTVARGCLSDTIIEDYVKTDNLCHIAHNDHIKKGAMLTAGVVISGSTVVGENAWLAPGSLLNNSIMVGDNSFLGIGTVATKNVESGKVVAGVPARILRDRYDV